MTIAGGSPDSSSTLACRGEAVISVRLAWSGAYWSQNHCIESRHSQ
jgi:hypothetical protein